MGDSEAFEVKASGSNTVPVARKLAEIIENNIHQLSSIEVRVESDSEIDIGGYSHDGYYVPDDRDSSSPGVKFNPDSDAFMIARAFYVDSGEWYGTEAVKHDLGDGDIDCDQLSQVLWDLSERGVLEKRDHPSDGRMKEYRLTKKGDDSVAKVAES